MILKLSLDLPEEASFVQTTRHLSRTLLEDIHVIKSDIDDVETIVAELCTNVIRHAKSKEKHFKVELQYFEPRVVIIVTDRGPGFNEQDISPVGTERPDGNGGVRIGGFGLTLLEGLTDKLDFSETDPHGTTVHAEKNLHYETPGDANDATERDKGSGGTVTISKD